MVTRFMQKSRNNISNNGCYSNPVIQCGDLLDDLTTVLVTISHVLQLLSISKAALLVTWSAYMLRFDRVKDDLSCLGKDERLASMDICRFGAQICWKLA
jgi:hypothetical protein